MKQQPLGIKNVVYLRRTETEVLILFHKKIYLNVNKQNKILTVKLNEAHFNSYYADATTTSSI